MRLNPQSGEKVLDLATGSGEAAWLTLSQGYGPTKTLANNLDEERRAALRRDFIAFHDGFCGELGICVPREYWDWSNFGPGFTLVASHEHRTHVPHSEENLMLGDRRPPILARDDFNEPSVFTPENLLREARRQKHLPLTTVPEVCVLDPDGDLVRQLRAQDRAERDAGWACYHTDLYRVHTEGLELGIVGCAVGASFAMLVAEQLFASGCRLLISMTSAGRLREIREPPYFILIDRALRDEGTSYHYLPLSEFSEADTDLLNAVGTVLLRDRSDVVRGATWTTDAPYRETERSIADRTARGFLAVEMEAAALYAFAKARAKRVVCFAHVTNQMAVVHGDFEKGEADGTVDALAVIGIAASVVVKADAPQ